MEIFFPAAVIFCVIYIFIINYKHGEIEETIEELEERLTKLEKDAVKVTFSEPPLFHRKPKTQTDYQNEHVIHPGAVKKPNPKQFDGAESDKPFVKTRKRKPKTTKDWEDEFDLGGHE
jgi:hypothetical protein